MPTTRRSRGRAKALQDNNSSLKIEVKEDDLPFESKAQNLPRSLRRSSRTTAIGSSEVSPKKTTAKAQEAPNKKSQTTSRATRASKRILNIKEKEEEEVPLKKKRSEEPSNNKQESKTSLLSPKENIEDEVDEISGPKTCSLEDEVIREGSHVEVSSATQNEFSPSIKNEVHSDDLNSSSLDCVIESSEHQQSSKVDDGKLDSSSDNLLIFEGDSIETYDESPLKNTSAERNSKENLRNTSGVQQETPEEQECGSFSINQEEDEETGNVLLSQINTKDQSNKTDKNESFDISGKENAPVLSSKENLSMDLSPAPYNKEISNQDFEDEDTKQSHLQFTSKAKQNFKAQEYEENNDVVLQDEDMIVIDEFESPRSSSEHEREDGNLILDQIKKDPSDENAVSQNGTNDDPDIYDLIFESYEDIIDEFEDSKGIKNSQQARDKNSHNSSTKVLQNGHKDETSSKGLPNDNEDNEASSRKLVLDEHTDEVKKSDSSKVPGASFLLYMRGKNKRPEFVCTLCNVVFWAPNIMSHVKSVNHLLKVLAVEDPDTYKNYKNCHYISSNELLKVVYECESYLPKQEIMKTEEDFTGKAASEAKENIKKLLYENVKESFPTKSSIVFSQKEDTVAVSHDEMLYDKIILLVHEDCLNTYFLSTIQDRYEILSYNSENLDGLFEKIRNISSSDSSKIFWIMFYDIDFLHSRIDTQYQKRHEAPSRVKIISKVENLHENEFREIEEKIMRITEKANKIINGESDFIILPPISYICISSSNALQCNNRLSCSNLYGTDHYKNNSTEVEQKNLKDIYWRIFEISLSIKGTRFRKLFGRSIFWNSSYIVDPVDDDTANNLLLQYRLFKKNLMKLEKKSEKKNKLDHIILVGANQLLTKVTSFDNFLQKVTCLPIDFAVDTDNYIRKKVKDLKKGKKVFVILVDALIIGQMRNSSRCDRDRCSHPFTVHKISTSPSNKFYMQIIESIEKAANILISANRDSKVVLMPIFPTTVFEYNLLVNKSVPHYLAHFISPHLAFFVEKFNKAESFVTSLNSFYKDIVLKYFKRENIHFAPLLNLLDNSQLLEIKKEMAIHKISEAELKWRSVFSEFMQHHVHTILDLDQQETKQSRSCSPMPSRKSFVREYNESFQIVGQKRLSKFQEYWQKKVDSQHRNILFKRAFLIGEEDLLKSFSDLNHVCKKIYIDFSKKSPSRAVSAALEKMGPLNVKEDACFLLFGICLGEQIETKALECSKKDCQEPITANYVPSNATDSIVADKTGYVRQLVKGFSQSIKTYVLPLYPRVIFFQQRSSESLYHSIAHKLPSKDAFIFYNTGRREQGTKLFTQLISAWMEMIKDNYKKFPLASSMLKEISKYTSESFIKGLSSEDLDVPWSAVGAWGVYVKYLFQVMVLPKEKATESKESAKSKKESSPTTEEKKETSKSKSTIEPTSSSKAIIEPLLSDIKLPSTKTMNKENSSKGSSLTPPPPGTKPYVMELSNSSTDASYNQQMQPPVQSPQFVPHMPPPVPYVPPPQSNPIPSSQGPQFPLPHASAYSLYGGHPSGPPLAPAQGLPHPYISPWGAQLPPPPMPMTPSTNQPFMPMSSTFNSVPNSTIPPPPASASNVNHISIGDLTAKNSQPPVPKTVVLKNSSFVIPQALFEEIANVFFECKSIDFYNDFRKDWKCLVESCENLNYNYRAFCNQCKAIRPHKSTILISFKNEDIASFMNYKLRGLRIADIKLEPAHLIGLRPLPMFTYEGNFNKEFSRINLKFSDVIGKKIEEKLNKVVDVSKFKTEPCPKNCNDPTRCMFYHSDKDKRRNPFSFGYSGVVLCPKAKQGQKCINGLKCLMSHSEVERDMHPLNYQKKLCDDGSTCSKRPFCTYAHQDSFDLLYHAKWKDCLIHGLWNSFAYLAAAIRGLCTSASLTGSKVIFLSPDQEILHLVQLSFNNIFANHNIRCLILDANKPVHNDWNLLVGKPSIVDNSKDSLFTDKTNIAAIIVDNISSIWFDTKEKMSLSSLLRRFKWMQHPLDKIRKVFVDDSNDDPNFCKSLSQFLSIDLATISTKDVYYEEAESTVPLNTSARKPATTPKRSITRSPSPPLKKNRKSPSPPPKKKRGFTSPPTKKKRLSPSTKDTRRSPSPLKKKHRSKSVNESPTPHSNYDEPLRHSRNTEKHGSSPSLPTSVKEIPIPHSKYDEFSKPIWKAVNNEVSRSSDIRHEKYFSSFSKSLTASNSTPPQNHADEIIPKPLQISLVPPKISKEVEEEYQVYLEVPELHPGYDKFYRIFSKQFDKTSSGEQNKDAAWEKFWASTVEKLKRSEMQKKMHEDLPKNETNHPPKFQSEPEKPSKLFSKPSPSSTADVDSISLGSTQDEDCSVEDTLNSLEQLKDQLGRISSSILSLIDDCRSKGTTTPQALAVFSDSEAQMILNMAINKLSMAMNTSSTLIRPIYEIAITGTKRLMENSKNATKFAKIDVESIAKATQGKNTTEIVNFIETALSYEGFLNPDKKEMKQLFGEVVSLQLKMLNNT